MAVTIETVANVVVKPDLSAFTQATEQDVVDLVVDAGWGLRPAEAQAIARALIATHWVVPR